MSAPDAVGVGEREREHVHQVARRTANLTATRRTSAASRSAAVRPLLAVALAVGVQRVEHRQPADGRDGQLPAAPRSRAARQRGEQDVGASSSVSRSSIRSTSIRRSRSSSSERASVHRSSARLVERATRSAPTAGRGPRASGPGRPGSAARRLAQLAQPALRELLDRGRDQRGARLEVVQVRAARDPGALGHARWSSSTRSPRSIRHSIAASSSASRVAALRSAWLRRTEVICDQVATNLRS